MKDSTQVTPEALERLDDGLWIASRALPLWVGDVGTRMTVVRLASGELLVHSPVALDGPTRDALDRIGAVRWVVGPSKVHHLYLGDYASACPAAVLCGARSLPEKRKDLRFSHVLGAGWTPPWDREVGHVLFEGAPALNEVVFYHAAARRSLDRILVWDFERIVVTHGSVLQSGGRARLEEAFAFLGAR